VQSIIVEVFDFDDDVDSVSFYYSKDFVKWELIDCRFVPEIDNNYKTMWETEKLQNGKYYLKIVASDKLGNQNELVTAQYEVTEGIDKNSDSSNSFGSSDSMWIVVLFVMIIIMVLVIVMLMKRSKRREKELIKEVTTELQKSRAMEGSENAEEIVPGIVAEKVVGYPQESGASVAGYDHNPSETEIETSDSPDQTYIPASQSPVNEQPDYEPEVETIESYKNQMDQWKAEGYNVSRLEQIYQSNESSFAIAFPLFSANISRLKNIAAKLESMEPSFSASETDPAIEVIRSKLLEPDFAENVESEFNDLRRKLGFVPQASPINVPKLPPNQPSNPLTIPVAHNQENNNHAQEVGSGTDVITVSPMAHPAEPTSEPDQDTNPYVNLEVPADIDIPPEIDLPPEMDVEDNVNVVNDYEPVHSEFPQSPFASAQTQSLEEELDSKTEILEIPNDPEHETRIDTSKEKTI
jgi:hypothetical protein